MSDRVQARTPAARAVGAGLVSAVLAGVLAGCGGSGKDEAVQDPQAELNARPTSVEMVDRYQQMYQKISDRLTAELGHPVSWRTWDEGRESTCSAEFAGLPGKEVYLPLRGFPGAIADADWPAAKRIVTEVAAEYGFTAPTMQVDQPGNHVSTVADLALGAQFTFGTQANTTMQVRTGCHRGTFG